MWSWETTKKADLLVVAEMVSEATLLIFTIFANFLKKKEKKSLSTVMKKGGLLEMSHNKKKTIKRKECTEQLD